MSLSEAEAKFFTSGGTDVDASLTVQPSLETTEPAKAAEPATPPAAPATPPASTTAEPPPAQAPQQVPLAALHEERQKRAKAETERQQLQAALEQLQKAQQQPPPDPQQDPLGFLAHENQQLKKQLDDVTQWRQQQEQQSQLLGAQRQFAQAVTSAEIAFRAKQPDYDAAAQFALTQYDKMLMALIPDPAQRRNQALIEAANAMGRVMSEGRDPAQFVYDFAKHMGYAPATAPTPTPTPAPVSDVVKTIERGLKQQTNLGGGGSTPPSEVTGEMALALSGEEFNKWWAKQFKR